MSNLYRIYILLVGLAIAGTMDAQIYGDPIVYWDFSDGLPSSWINESESQIGNWEYRGLSTSPNNTICSQGSCGIGSVPIASQSLANGFMIFDSNYWDDDIGPCGNIGAGQDPGPHEAWLITNSIDLTGVSTPTLTFQQQYKHFQSAQYDVYTSILISIDGGENFTVIHENPGDYMVSPPAEWVNIPIGSIAANQSDVQIKFLFTGVYYWWCIDDVAIYQPNQEDLLIANPKFTEFDFNLEPAGFGDMEYSSYASTMLPEFNFSGKCINIGATAANGSHFEVRVNDSENNEVHFQATNPFNLVTGGSILYEAPNSYVPNLPLGSYEIEFLMDQTEVDDAYWNNFAYKNFNIHPFQMALDRGVSGGQFIPPVALQNQTIEIGNVFVTWEYGHQINSISFSVGDSSDAGTPVYGVVYDLERDEIYGQTATYEINVTDINGSPQDSWVTLPLLEPIATTDTSLFLIMIVDSSDFGNFYVNRSGGVPEFVSQVAFPETNGLYYLLEAAAVRMNLFPAGVISGCLDSNAMNFNNEATADDFYCLFAGCTDVEASNYDSSANWDDGGCVNAGCTDPEADNYDPDAEIEDGSCQYLGCIDENANNYNSTANTNDGSCVYSQAFMSVNQMVGCVPLTITILNQTELGEESECTFDLGDDTIITTCETSITHIYTEPGNYTINYSHTIGEFQSDFQISPIEVFANPEPPVISFDSGTNEISCDCPFDISYTWFFNDIQLTDTSAQINPENNGIFNLLIVDDYGCSATSNDLPVVVTHLDEVPNNFNATIVYPNPTEDWFFITTPLVNSMVTVVDLYGRVIHKEQLTGESTMVKTDNWASGSYIVRISTEEKTESIRLLVQ
jgi:hypothetical protein